MATTIANYISVKDIQPSTITKTIQLNETKSTNINIAKEYRKLRQLLLLVGTTATTLVIL
jgi:hypothetical protein